MTDAVGAIPSDQPAIFKIEATPPAVRQLKKLDEAVRRRVVAAIDRLAMEPRPSGVKALTGHPGMLRIRIGDYRVVYTVRDGELIIVVIAAAHRREIYRDL